MDYSSAIPGFKEYKASMDIHARAIRSFLGTPKNVTIPGVLSEIDLLLPIYRTKLQMVRFYHRLLKMDNNRITKKVLNWDKYLNESSIIKTWSSDMKNIFSECDLTSIFESDAVFNKIQVISNMRTILHQQQQKLLEQECKLKPKLRTFLLFKVFDEPAAYVGKPLSFHQRRIIAKTRLGCLPLRIETGRYTRPRLREEERTCLVCRAECLLEASEANVTYPVENEAHFIFDCAGYESERDHWLGQLILPENFTDLGTAEKLKIVLNLGSNVRATAQFILGALHKRSRLLN